MLKTLLGILLCCMLIMSCSGDPGERKKEAKTETAQERLGHNLAEELKAPLDQARSVEKEMDDRVEKIQQQAKEGRP